MGPPCALPRESPGLCFESCPHECDPYNTCDLASCYDDTAFARAVVDYVDDNYCLDKASVHLGKSSSLWSSFLKDAKSDLFFLF